MRSADGWQDVAIRNVSAHGMKISVALPPRSGAVIEIRRAAQIIVARAVWVHDSECGLRTQDVVDIPALLDPNAARAEAAIETHRSERRSAPRVHDTAQRSRHLAARMQHAAIVAAVVAGAGAAAWTVGSVMHAPFARIGAALGSGASAGDTALPTVAK